MTASEKFRYQLECIKNCITRKTILMGDFNLDYSKVNDVNYCHAGRFNDFNEILDVHERLIQMVNFPTWSRMVGMSYRSSIESSKLRRLKYTEKFN